MAVNKINFVGIHQAQSDLTSLSAKASLSLYSAFLSFLLALVFSLSPIQSFADPALPDAPYGGQILQQIQRDLEFQPAPTLPEQAPKEKVVEEAPADLVVIKEFKFTGNHAIEEAELKAALASITNRSISIAELKTATDLTSALYNKKGVLATVNLPEQDITEGVVLIEVIEAVFAGVKIDGTFNKDYKRIRPCVIERFIEACSPIGQPVDQKKIDRALALLQRLPGFKVDASYQPGEKERSTQLLIKVVDSPLLSFGLSADNSGGRSTGKRKETATINLASPLKMGDLLNITALHTDGTDYARVAYTIPVGGSGLKVGANSSYMKYKFLTSMEGSELTPLGHSVTYNVNANYPIVLGKQANLSAEVNYDKKYFLNQMASTEPTATESDYKLDVASLLISGSYIDGILAGGQTNASVNIIYGSVNLEGSPNITRDFEGANTQGRYKRLHLNFSRNQFITDSVSLNFDASGQVANRNLDSSEKFYLGGINGVRAYPTSEGSGSEGYLFKVELYKFLPYNFNASIFWDKGHVKQYHLSKLSPESTFKPVGPPNYSLEGYGASLAWSGPYQSSLKATYSHRVGQNPNPSTINNVNDQDGSLNMNVYWLTGSIAF
mgnify:FL=1